MGDPTAGEGVNADRLGTITCEDGSTQVAYNGWPLYYFAPDEKPGETNGQYGTWFVVSAFGGPIQTNAVVKTVGHAEFGSILADASGRSLYLFTPDELNVSTCTGDCALAWPPLLTVNDPRAEGTVVGVAAWLNTITRPDGSRQVTHNGIPLYYFARDDKPGDTNGQTVGDVWFVVSIFGEAIGMTASTPPAGSGGPVAPALPITGDTAVSVIARWSLVASLILISTGGLILVRRRRRIVPGPG